MTRRRTASLPLFFMLSSAFLYTTNTFLLSTLPHHRRHHHRQQLCMKAASISSLRQAPSRSYSRSNTFLKDRSETAGAEEDINAIPDSKRKLSEVKNMIAANLASDVLNVKVLRQTVKDMEEESSQAEFWENQEKAQALLLEMNRLKNLIKRAEGWESSCDDIEVLLGNNCDLFCFHIV